MFKFLLLLVSLTSHPLIAKTGKVLIETKQEVLLEGQVGRNMLSHFLKETNDWKEGEAVVYINSPGGSVFLGHIIAKKIEEMKYAGIKVHCYVDDLAASMAYIIWMSCEHQYAAPGALLLWHPPRVSGRVTLTPKAALDLYESLRYIERYYNPRIMTKMKVSEEFYYKHYHMETLHFAEMLHLVSPFFEMVYVFGVTDKEPSNDKEDNTISTETETNTDGTVDGGEGTTGQDT